MASPQTSQGPWLTGRPASNKRNPSAVLANVGFLNTTLVDARGAYLTRRKSRAPVPGAIGSYTVRVHLHRCDGGPPRLPQPDREAARSSEKIHERLHSHFSESAR